MDRQPAAVRRRLIVAGGAGTLAGFGTPAWLRAAEPGVGASRLLIAQTITLQDGKNAYGMAVQSGVRLVLEAVNAAGGVQGRRLELRTLDDGNDAGRAADNARQLIAEGPFLLFGSLEGGPSMAAAKVADEARVPLFGPMAGSPGLRRPHLPMVFPVRAEHRDEFRALMGWARATGLRSVGFFHADSDTGREHLRNVTLIAAELGLEVALALPFNGTLDDAGLDAMVGRIEQARPGVVLNHGSAGLYARLVRRAKEAGSRTVFMGVNSGSTQIAQALGPLALNMVFSQVTPNPGERKTALVRDYQDAARRTAADAPLSYGALEGFMTARALVAALRAAGREPTRAGFIRGLYAAPLDLGGVKLRYAAGDHEGSRFVDLSMVARDGRFIH